MASKAWLYLAGAVGSVALVMVLPRVFGGGRFRLLAGDRILLVGDSLAGGLRYALGALAKDHGVPFTTVYENGTRTEAWAGDRLAQALADNAPTVVFVSLGTNDAVAPREGLADRVRAIAEIARTAGARVLWLLPPSMPFPTDLVRQAVDEAHIPAIDVGGQTFARGPDRIHPMPSESARWATLIWQAVS